MRSRGSACTEVAYKHKLRSPSFTFLSTPPGSARQGWQLAGTCPGPHILVQCGVVTAFVCTGRHLQTLDPTLCMWEAGAHEAGDPDS